MTLASQRRTAATEVVRRDIFDREDYTSAFDTHDALRAMHAELEERSSVGGALLADLWAALFKMNPRTQGVDLSHKVNAEIMERVLDSDRWRDLHDLTVDDALGSALGCVAMKPAVGELQERLSDVQAKADAAQEAQDRYEEALEDAIASAGGRGDDGALPDLPPSTRDGIDRLKTAADQAAGDLDDALYRDGPLIGKTIRDAVDAAAERAEDEQQVAQAWGVQPGELSRMDPTERIKMMQALLTDDMRAIAAQFGQFRNDAFTAKGERYDAGLGEIVSVTQGGDLGLLLPSAFGLFLDPTGDPEVDDIAELLFLQKLKDRELPQYDVRRVVHEARGGILFLEDSSLSMRWGNRWHAAKGFGLATLAIAKEQQRAFSAIVFGGPNQWGEVLFPCPADFTTSRMVEYAQLVLDDAGTDFQTPLGRAVQLLEDEYAATGKTTADIVLATDGECAVSDTWLEGFREAKDRLKFRVWCVAIGGEPTTTLEKLADWVARIEDLAAPGASARDVFRKVWSE